MIYTCFGSDVKVYWCVNTTWYIDILAIDNELLIKNHWDATDIHCILHSSCSFKSVIWGCNYHSAQNFLENDRPPPPPPFIHVFLPGIFLSSYLLKTNTCHACGSACVVLIDIPLYLHLSPSHLVFRLHSFHLQ